MITRIDEFREHISESVGEVKKYVITFTNDKFYVADATKSAFVNILKKMDQALTYDRKMNSTSKPYNIHIKSSVLTHEQIRNAIREFTKNYDHLSMSVVTTR